ncbi:hypothetical protein FHT71_001103 [Rhizobium sp. BK060]|nr:hypothetical protein [Rhizobium sp. BK060]
MQGVISGCLPSLLIASYSYSRDRCLNINRAPLCPHLHRMRPARPPVKYEGRRKKLVWVLPTIIAEIEHRAWTHDRKLRQASYKGLREVQDSTR